MNALVLSGGGAKGAFQAGAIYALYEKGIKFDVIAGVSVGSLNGAMVAQDKIEEMKDVWHTVTNEDVYVKYPMWIAALRLLFGKKSVYDAKPLYQLLTKHIKKEDFKHKYILGLTSETDKKYYSLSVDDFDSTKNLIDGIFASALMPIIWEPVKEVKTIHGTVRMAVDGGLRNITPLKDVVCDLPDHIYIVNCNNPELEEHEPTKFLEIVTSTLDILLSEIVLNDVETLLDKNDLVLQAAEKGVKLFTKSGRELKYFEVTLIQPPGKIGSPINFDPETMKKNFQLGYNSAK